MKKFSFVKALFIAMAFCVSFNIAAFAKNIYSLSLTIKPEISIGESVGTENIIINNDVENEKYDVASAMVINHKASTWALNDEPEILITLASKDKYKFKTKMKKTDVSVTNLLTGSGSGSGAVVEELKILNGGYGATIKVKLDKLANTHTGKIDAVTLSTDGVLSWGEAVGSSSYEVAVFKNDYLYKTIIADKTNTTTHKEKREVFGSSSGPTGTAKDAKIKAQGTTQKEINVLNYDLKSLVNEPANYYVQVTPLNGVNSMIRGEKVVSNGVYLQA